MALLRRLSAVCRSSWHCFSRRPGSERSSGEGRAIVDETLVWNQVMLDAIVAGNLGNPQTIRMAATVNTAMFDAAKRRQPEVHAHLRDPDRAARHPSARGGGAGRLRHLEGVLSGPAGPVRQSARSVARRVQRRRPGERPARRRLGRERRQPGPGVAGDRRLQQPGVPVQRRRRSDRPVGVRDRGQPWRRATSPSPRRSC